MRFVFAVYIGLSGGLCARGRISTLADGKGKIDNDDRVPQPLNEKARPKPGFWQSMA
jgi:hypothetical protein